LENIVQEYLKKLGGKIMDALKLIAQDSMKPEMPKFAVGDTVKVYVNIKEGDKTRIQVFEGTVIARKHGGINETFTVRRLSHGCGVERVFPVHSPAVEKVEVVRSGKVRRAKLYYLRDRVGKAAKVKEQIIKQ
jgi:large subunit ribosomal protein L19